MCVCVAFVQRNTYQVVLATDGKASYSLFLYSAIEWTSWSTRGGTVTHTAQVGFNKGDGSHFFAPFIDNLSTLPVTSNVNVPGLYVYRIDGADISPRPGTYYIV